MHLSALSSQMLDDICEINMSEDDQKNREPYQEMKNEVSMVGSLNLDKDAGKVIESQEEKLVITEVDDRLELESDLSLE